MRRRYYGGTTEVAVPCERRQMPAAQRTGAIRAVLMAGGRQNPQAGRSRYAFAAGPGRSVKPAGSRRSRCL